MSAFNLLNLKAVNKAWWGEVCWLLPSRADNKEQSGVLEYQEPVNAIDCWSRSQIRLPLGLLFPLRGCFFRGSLVGRPRTRSHVALRRDDDSQEWVPNVPSSRNCCERTLENVVSTGIGEIWPHAEVQLHNVDIEDSDCCCLLASCGTAQMLPVGKGRLSTNRQLQSQGNEVISDVLVVWSPNVSIILIAL